MGQPLGGNVTVLIVQLVGGTQQLTTPTNVVGDQMGRPVLNVTNLDTLRAIALRRLID